MVPAAGERLAQVPALTQWLLCRLNDGTAVMIVPLYSDAMSFSLEGKSGETLELLGETNDAMTVSTGGLALFVSCGDDPYELAAQGAASVAKRLGVGKLRKQKAVPPFANLFGWCTWDAFYGDVSHEKVEQGLASFAAAGMKPRALILDDGWLSTKPCRTGGKRLSAFEANEKFPGGLKHTVAMAKERYGIDQFLVWHAVNGYWAGIDAEAFKDYAPVEVIPRGGKHVNVNPAMEWFGTVTALINPKRVRKFFDAFHAFLKDQGVDGVKIDNQGSLQYLADRQGGRVALFKAFRAAIEASVKRNFGGALINCMGHPLENWYQSPVSNIMRTSTDFWPRRPETHGGHLYTNAQVCVWFGEFLLGDWDMFQSGHEMGAFHAAGRAVSGSPVYVSDKPGGHNADLLRKLVCSDGTTLRALEPGRPTADCLFHDVTREPVLLKIFNRNAHGAVVGVFNARYHAAASEQTALKGQVLPADVPGLKGTEFALYAHNAAKVCRGKREWGMAIELAEGQSEVVTLAPLVAGVAVIGLTNFYNASGAVASVVRETGVVRAEVRDGGQFNALCTSRPASVRADGVAVEFTYSAETGLLTVALPVPGRHTLEIVK